MSVVGPRPHAVAHNEEYRKLIKGTMLRHKVKPGITGWAQVNGMRGETQTLDKMRARVQYDIDTMRDWTRMYDLIIITKTCCSCGETRCVLTDKIKAQFTLAWAYRPTIIPRQMHSRFSVVP